MPTRWWLPIDGPVDPKRIRLQHTHAALASWLDRLNADAQGVPSEAEHDRTVKPWFASPISQATDGSFGFEVSALTDQVADFLTTDPPADGLRLGPFRVRTGAPRLISAADWESLAAYADERSWTVSFLTPTCFRLRGSGGTVTPLPSVDAILRALDTYWTAYSGQPARLPTHEAPGVTVAACDIRSHRVAIGRRPSRNGPPSEVPGFVGELTFTAPPAAAEVVGPLFHLVDYVSIGSFARRGLGVARLTATSTGAHR